MAEAGCRALLTISCYPAGQVAVLEAHGPVAIVAALRTHPAAVGVASYGCVALGNVLKQARGRALGKR